MRLIFTAALLSALSLTQPAWAQEQRGAIEGDVRDAQRAVLPGECPADIGTSQVVACGSVFR